MASIDTADYHRYFASSTRIQSHKLIAESHFYSLAYASSYSKGVNNNLNALTEETKMTREESIKCNAIIHTASVAAGSVGAGLAQIPGSDNAVIVPIQVTMIMSLGEVFGQHIGESAAKGMAAANAIGMVGRTVSQVFICWFPGVGNAINATTAAALTEALGWAVANKLSNDAN